MTEILVSNSLFLWLTAPLELIAAPLSVPVWDAKLAARNYQVARHGSANPQRAVKRIQHLPRIYASRIANLFATIRWNSSPI